MQHPNVTVYPLAKIVSPENVAFGEHVIIDDFVFIVAGPLVYLGDYTHIASFTSITGRERFTLGAYSTLSSGVRICTSTEELKAPSLLGSAVPSPYRTVVSEPVSIGTHCMVGANSVVLPGAAIPDGVVIGALSLVRAKDKLKPWGIYAGSPLRFIRKRDREAILDLQRWFELEEEG